MAEALVYFEALNKRFIKTDQSIIVHNPDDQLVGDFQTLFNSVIKQHLHNAQKYHTVARSVVVEGVVIPGSCLALKDSLVTGLETEVVFPRPVHCGITVFTQQAYAYFKKLFTGQDGQNFENILWPLLIKKESRQHGKTRNYSSALRDLTSCKGMRLINGF